MVEFVKEGDVGVTPSCRNDFGARAKNCTVYLIHYWFYILLNLFYMNDLNCPKFLKFKKLDVRNTTVLIKLV